MRGMSAAAAREVQRDTALRQARTCYGHLAGVAGVELLDELLRRGWLAAEEASLPRYLVTPEGERALGERGVAPPASRRPAARPCLDWTERRPHLGGALGVAIVDGLERRGLLRREQGSRVVTLRGPLSGWLDGPAEARASA